MSTAISTGINRDQIVAINQAASECRSALADAGNDVGGFLVIADSMARLRACLTAEVMRSVCALQGSAVGFKTDKDANGGYRPEELRDFALEAFTRGFRLVGNECNVIAGRFYGAKAGFERLVKTYPGLSGYSDAYDVMEVVSGNAKVQAVATFQLDGRPMRFARQVENMDGRPFDNRISVRVNQGMGPDAIVGKAQRKFYAWLYDRLIGAVVDTPEGEAGDGDAATQQKELVPMFSGGLPPEAKKQEDDGCPIIVAEYRGKFSAVAERGDIGKLVAAAGRDARLTPKGRAAVAALGTEAQKAWPNRLDGGQPPEDKGRTDSDAAQDDPAIIDQYTVQIMEAKAQRDLAKIELHAKNNPALSTSAREQIIDACTRARQALSKGTQS